MLVDVEGRGGDLLVRNVLVRLTRVHHVQALNIWRRYRAIRKARKVHEAVRLRLRLLVQTKHWMGPDRWPIAFCLNITSIFTDVSNIATVVFSRWQYLALT